MRHPEHPGWVESGPADGELVVLIHGAMDRAAGLARLARRLDDRCRVLRYDRRGYGRQIEHLGPYTVEANVADLMELLGGRSAVLVGHSLGGDIALAAAARYPVQVAAVSVFEPPISWEGFWPSNTAGALAQQADQSPQDAAERFMRRLIGDARWEGLPERTRATRRAEGPALVGELADLRRQAPWMGRDIRCPVLVGVSDHAAAHHRLGTAYVVEAIPGARLVELIGCHHDAHASVPAAYAEQLVVPLLREA